MGELIRRNSKQRQLILDAVRSTQSHPTAEQIYQMVKIKNPSISLGTVYRNLNLLTELGEIQKIQCGSQSDHFDGVRCEHPHRICTACGCISDLPESISEHVRKVIEDEGSSPVDAIQLNVFWLCEQCRQEQNN